MLRLRQIFLTHSQALARNLGLQARSAASEFAILFTSFFLSGLIHYGGDYCMMSDLREVGPMVFFLLQAVGIVVESCAISLAMSLGVKKGNAFLRWMGYLWVLLWISWTLPFWTDPYHKFGMREWMPRASLIHWLWKGAWVWI